MEIQILTIFPEMFAPFWDHGIVGRAISGGRVSAAAVNIREHARDRHHTTDDRPYGGGCGMVMKPEPLAAAIRTAKEAAPSARTIHLTPQGKVFDQSTARELATLGGLIFVCGRYEGVDERIRQSLVDEEISIGDYVLTGGELAAMVVIDAVVRLIPGVLGGDESAQRDSFWDGLLEHGHYTRPRTFEGMAVPEVLLSGNHGEIDRWRLETSLIRTFLRRRDLLEERKLSREETQILTRWREGIDELIRRQSPPGAGPLSGGQQKRR